MCFLNKTSRSLEKLEIKVWVTATFASFVTIGTKFSEVVANYILYKYNQLTFICNVAYSCRDFDIFLWGCFLMPHPEDLTCFGKVNEMVSHSQCECTYYAGQFEFQCYFNLVIGRI